MFGIRKSNFALICSGLTLLAFIIRAIGISWQPLWWDEGYSVYFATEPLPQMLSLTASDIHPPLYYGALSGWIQVLGSSAPPALRLFSLFCGVLALPLLASLANSLFYPEVNERRIAFIALLLLTLNPLHLYYSQEIRMYGLAMTLTLWSTVAFWQLITAAAEPMPRPWQLSGRQLAWINYVVATTLSLYTLYYSAFVPLTHLLFGLWHHFIRPLGSGHASIKERPASRPHLEQTAATGTLLSTQFVIGLLYLPWLIYASRNLITYVPHKVDADNDASFSPLLYLGRHIVAFIAGHLPLETLQVNQVGRYSGIVLAASAVAFWSRHMYKKKRATFRRVDHAGLPLDPIQLLSFLLLCPLAAAFVLHQQFPFFPSGGERLLLVILPYFILLLAYGIARLSVTWLGSALVGLLVLVGITGVFIYHTTPRYRQRDYREVVRYVMQHGAADDQVLMLFPWQVGYWRAYAPQADKFGPRPQLVGDGTLVWDESFRQLLEKRLKQGTLWFPAPLGLGSDLPGEIIAYLQSLSASANTSDFANADLAIVENFWANPTTLLTAWRHIESPPLQRVGAQIEALVLADAGLLPRETTSSNSVVAVKLNWVAIDPVPRTQYQLTLRLQDETDRIWADQNYTWDADTVKTTTEAQETWTDTRGFIVPAGLPPGSYQLTVQLSRPDEAIPQADLQPGRTERVWMPLDVHWQSGETTQHVSIGRIRISAPAAPLPVVRLEVENAQPVPPVIKSVAFLGHKGTDGNSNFLSGTHIPLWLYFQNRNSQPTDQLIYLSVLDRFGSGVAGWEGWPLPAYPLSAWPFGALVKVPVPLQLPARLASGEYMLVSGFIDPESKEKSSTVELDTINVVQRVPNYRQPEIPHRLGNELESIQLGTHVYLLGYDLQPADSDLRHLEIRLYWRVIQTLLPQHHIFVHLSQRNASPAAPLAQHDDLPQALLNDETRAAAPTGSWLPDEYLTTVHRLSIPQDLQLNLKTNALNLREEKLEIRVGLYVPSTGVRLPVYIDGVQVGDSVSILGPGP